MLPQKRKFRGSDTPVASATMTPPMSTSFRTHTCGELRAEHVGQRVMLAGWVHRRRDHGHLAFFDLRDRHGITQVVTHAEEAAEAHAAAEPARNEWVVQVEGTVRHRPEGTANAELGTGEIEVAVDRFIVLNPSKVPPFYINEEQPGLDESLRLKHRYLDLRRPPMQGRMLLRARLASAIRAALEDEGFVEVETPTLIRSTPEGARDFVVPSRLRPGEFYALPQSPQQLKQLLMVAGYDRYYQLAHAYRDEDGGRVDRQPEHTQVDIEMSFVTEEDVISTVERVVTRVAKEVLPERPILSEPFPRLTYAEAMDRYGSDKPDIRFGLELVDITEAVREVDFRVFSEPIAAGGAVRAIVAPGCGDYSRKQLDELIDLAKRHGAKGLVHLSVPEDGTLHGPAAKFLEGREAELIETTGASAGDLILIVADADPIACAEALGHVRLAMGDRLGERLPGVLAYVWVHRFPMFTWEEESQRWDATHNPFSAPVPEDVPLMDSDPGAVRAQQYDLALNGWESGGGSVRIHQRDLLEKAFGLMGHTVEGMRDQFGALLDALEYGAPPHGGIAIGLDRWAALFAEVDNIREVMAFPKTQSGTDLMMGAPSPITPQQLEELRLRIVEDD
jgi:aspartyl-tRNA synthetase